MNLNAAQRRAVEHEGSPLVVLAGPGTGKTRVITERVAHLINERGAAPERILAITFTNKAAGELRSRLAETLPRGMADRVQAFTFHAWGLRVLRRYGDRTALGRAPMLIDSAQERRLLTELVLESGVLGDLPAGVRPAVDEARETIARLRHGAVTPARAIAFADDRATAATTEGERADLERFGRFARLFSMYDGACLSRGWATFDDLLIRPAELIAHDPLAAARIRSDCAHVVVDEFQDVNTAQIELLGAIAPPGSRPDLVVVGDDDQSIYAFRGADDRAFARFGSRWTDAETIELTETYRSARPIVDVSQRVIARAGARYVPDKRLVSPRADDERHADASVEIVRLADNNQGGEVIATMIGSHLAALPEGERRWSRFAVIGRTWTELGRVRSALELAGIPVVSAGGSGVLADQGVQDLLEWARLVCDPSSPGAAGRLLRRPPISLDASRVFAWERAWRAAVSRGESRPFSAWVVDEHGDDPELGERVRRFGELLAELITIAGQDRADAAIAEIIRRTGLVEGDLVSGRERAARVSAVVSVLRFVRERVMRAEQPHDLRAFLRYYDDLDSRDQDFSRSTGEAVVEAEEGVSAEEAEHDGAVALMTAHGAKGLEFDTVFVPGVAPTNKWPGSSSDDNPLPEGLIDRLGDERSERERVLDEERRLFYVACTRAQRRLVMLGKVPAKSSTTNFLVELLADEDVSVRESAAVLEGAGERDVIDRLLDDYKRRLSARDALDAAARDARLDAAAAMARAAGSGGDPGAAIESLASAARRAAAVSHVRAHAEAPEWATGEVGEFARSLAERVRSEGAADAGGGFPGLRGPLELSFTQIDQYRRCPRCAYVAQVLRLGESPGAAMSFGSAMHDALERFYAEWRDADAEGRDPPGEAELIALTRAAVEAACPPDAELDRSLLVQGESQARVMLAKLHDPRTNVTELERRITFPYEHAGMEHRITAKLDRVDDDGGRARIIDYKTGAATKARTEPKELAKDLQMGIYVMALRHFRDDPELDGECEYWLLASGERGRVAFGDLDMDKIRAEIGKAIDGMLAGEWGQSRECQSARHGPGVCTILDRA